MIRMTDQSMFKCEICNRIFGTKEALAMHNAAKHSGQKSEEKIQKTNYKKIRNLAIFLLILGLVMWGIYALMTSPNSYDNLPASEINIGSHQNIALHIHSDLKILIDGQENLIPANIGVSTGIMRPLHTHDSTGEIHIEGPYKRDFRIGEFFQIWGMTFNSTCIFENCTDKGELKMLVNGQENSQFDNYVMRDNDEIRIEFISI